MDGLLIDSEPTWLAVRKEVLRYLYGLTLSSAQHLQYQGTSTMRFAKAIATQYPELAIDAGTLHQAILNAMAKRLDQIPLLPGACQLLQQLANQGIPMAIASASPREFIDTIVRRHSLPITVIASGYEVEHSKPHPGVFMLAAERLGVDPQTCVVWEDSLNGVIAAKAATMTVVAIPELHSPWAYKFALADHISPSLTDSQQLITQLFPPPVVEQWSLGRAISRPKPNVLVKRTDQPPE